MIILPIDREFRKFYEHCRLRIRENIGADEYYIELYREYDNLMEKYNGVIEYTESVDRKFVRRIIFKNTEDLLIFKLTFN